MVASQAVGWQWENVAAGSVAGLATVTFSHPLDVVRTSIGVTPKSAAFGARSSNLSDAYLKLNSICFRRSISGFRCDIERKWGNLSMQGGGRRNRGGFVERENRGRRGLGFVKCTAEGIERGILTAESGFVMPERFKVVALMACVM